MLEVLSVKFRYLGLGGNLRHDDAVSFCLGGLVSCYLNTLKELIRTPDRISWKCKTFMEAFLRTPTQFRSTDVIALTASL